MQHSFVLKILCGPITKDTAFTLKFEKSEDISLKMSFSVLLHIYLRGAVMRVVFYSDNFLCKPIRADKILF